MAREAVIMYRCDSCQVVGEPEKPSEGMRVPIRLSRDPLPEDWVELKAAGNRGIEFNMHICESCTTEASRLLMGMSLDSKPVKDVNGFELKDTQDANVPRSEWSEDKIAHESFDLTREEHEARKRLFRQNKDLDPKTEKE